jgi:predicted MFS family arabinose efflux permease
MTPTRRRASPASAYTGFASFGIFWGVWGASIPAVRDQAAVTEGQLGIALLFVGAGALPAMLLTGRALDRWGTIVSTAVLCAFGVSAACLSFGARGVVSLSACLAAIGFTSGATDVALNSLSASAERSSGRPVIARSHAAFSAAVVAASLGVGGARALGLPAAVPFLFALLTCLAAAMVVAVSGRQLDTALPAPGRDAAAAGADHDTAPARLRLGPLIAVGVLGALAFAVENAHQSWSAVYLHDVAAAGGAGAALGPAVFAAMVAATRFAISLPQTMSRRLLMLAGAGLAASGTLLLAISTGLAPALLGLALGGVGTAVLFPTLMSLVAEHVPEWARGTATSIVTTVAYLGFLGGPVYVGWWASSVSLPGAMFAVAGLAGVLLVITAFAIGRLSRLESPWLRP